MIRRAKRTDANHTQLVADLRARGYAVSDLSAVGRGCPDLLVSKDGRGLLVEVKSKANRGGKARGAKQAETLAAQALWRELHPGVCIVAYSVEDVERAFTPNETRAPEENPERPR